VCKPFCCCNDTSKLRLHRRENARHGGLEAKEVCQRCWDRLGKPSPFGGLRHVLVKCKVPVSLDWHVFSAFVQHSTVLLVRLLLAQQPPVLLFLTSCLIAALSSASTFKCTRVPCSQQKKLLSRHRFR
jgi:hypothetical protein